MGHTRDRRDCLSICSVIVAVFVILFIFSFVSVAKVFAATNIFKIEDVELSELSSTTSGTIGGFDDSIITSNITFHKLNDYAKYTVTLKNTSSNERIIESISDNNENPYISYKYDSYARRENR